MKSGKILLVMFLSLSILFPGSYGYPDLEYYVTDDVGVLLLQDIYEIEELCVVVETETGAQIAVLIVNSTAPDTIDTYAVETFEKSEIGREGKDDGLLLVVAVGDQTWRIEVGYGLEGFLPDLKVNDIAETYLIPNMAKGYYYEAILYTVAELGWIIVENYTGEPPGIHDDGPWYPIPFIPLNWWQLLIAISVTFIVLILTGGRLFLWIGGSSKGGGGNFGGGRSGGGGSSGRW